MTARYLNEFAYTGEESSIINFTRQRKNCEEEKGLRDTQSEGLVRFSSRLQYKRPTDSRGKLVSISALPAQLHFFLRMILVNVFRERILVALTPKKAVFAIIISNAYFSPEYMDTKTYT